jgi:hypothetical protein
VSLSGVSIMIPPLCPYFLHSILSLVDEILVIKVKNW